MLEGLVFFTVINGKEKKLTKNCFWTESENTPGFVWGEYEASEILVNCKDWDHKPHYARPAIYYMDDIYISQTQKIEVATLSSDGPFFLVK